MFYTFKFNPILFKLRKQYRFQEEKIKTMEELKAAAAVSQRGSLKSQKPQVVEAHNTELQECQDDTDLQIAVDFFKKLNLNKFTGFENLTGMQKVR